MTLRTGSRLLGMEGEITLLSTVTKQIGLYHKSLTTKRNVYPYHRFPSLAVNTENNSRKNQTLLRVFNIFSSKSMTSRLALVIRVYPATRCTFDWIANDFIVCATARHEWNSQNSTKWTIKLIIGSICLLFKASVDPPAAELILTVRPGVGGKTCCDRAQIPDDK